MLPENSPASKRELGNLGIEDGERRSNIQGTEVPRGGKRGRCEEIMSIRTDNGNDKPGYVIISET